MNGREAANAAGVPLASMDNSQGSFECFCGDRVGSRDELIQHNMANHGMDESESRRKVMEKYPQEG